MAEEAASTQVTPGKQTSEFGLAKALVVVAGVLDLVSILMETLHGAGVLPDKPWVVTALAVVATVMAGFKALGYTRSRTLLKLAELQPKAASGVADTAPFAKATAAAVLELLQGREAQEAPTPPEPREPPSGPTTLPLQPR